MPVLLAVAARGHTVSPLWRLRLSFAVYLLYMLGVPLLTQFSHNTKVSLGATLGGVLLSGVASAVMFATSFGLASSFPPRYTQAVMFGNAVAGVYISAVRVITKWAWADQGVVVSAYVFFGLAAATVLATVVAVELMHRHSAFFRVHVEHAREAQRAGAVQSGDRDDVTEPLLSPESAGGSTRSVSPTRQSSRGATALAWSRVQAPFLVNLLTFTITATLWPGFVTAAQQPKSFAPQHGWWQIWLIVTFCIGDFIGRFVSVWRVPFAATAVLAVLRLGFLPAIFLMTPEFQSQIVNVPYAFAMAATLPLTGGWLGGMCMIEGAERVRRSHVVERGGFLMTLSLNGGIVAGSAFSILALYVTTGSIFSSGAG